MKLSIGLIGKKSGMSRLFLEDGESIPVTAVSVCGNFVADIKTADKNGYNALVISKLKKFNNLNKSQKESSLENIYKNLESGMPENKSIKEYALPNARQWLGGRYLALWVLPIYLIRKIAKLAASSAFIKPYSPIKNGPSYKRPETLYTSLKGVFKGEDHLRFFDHRFIAIWVLPIALTGIVFEVLFISPTKNTFPFN